jgi:coenzyme F420-reducing hydrogenase delta subunit/Pyruvate/2-oxoacid:ferredoxin oxidoreductase delta subunit
VGNVPVGLYLSRCRGTLGTPDVDAIAARFRDRVDVCRVVEDFFAPDVQKSIVAEIGERGLGGVVLAGNSVEHHMRSLSGPQLKESIVDAGVNPNRVAFANLLEQVALPHSADAAGAMAKAVALVGDAIARARTFPAIEIVETVPDRSVLLLGATAASIVAAQRLLRLGYTVTLADTAEVDPSLSIGGSFHATGAFVSSHPGTTVIGNAALADADGWIGDYAISLTTPDGTRPVHVGGIIIDDAAAWIEPLRAHYALSVDDEGLPLSLGAAHPARTVDPGIMLMPAHDEDDVGEVIRAADAAALAVVLHLSVPKTVRALATSVVDESLCGGCASCVKTCAFGACSIDPETRLSHVDVRRCHGCGKCVVSCPVGARDVMSSPHVQMLESIRAMSAADLPAPRVLGFLCAGCGYPAADAAGRQAAEGGESYPASFLPIRIPCGGRLDALYVLEAIAAGFDGVAVFRCREGHCQNLVGNLDMDRRINLLRTVLRSRGIDDARLRIIDISPDEGVLFAQEVDAFFSELEPLLLTEGSLR